MSWRRVRNPDGYFIYVNETGAEIQPVYSRRSLKARREIRVGYLLLRPGEKRKVCKTLAEAKAQPIQGQLF